MLTTELVLGVGRQTITPSTIAVPRNGGALLFGYAALNSDPKAYDLISNWKLLLGKTSLQVDKESLADPLLERVLQSHTLAQLLQAFIAHIAQEYFCGLEPKPQLIVGIPTTSTLESKAARNRYRNLVSQALRKEGFPEPKFFPEPFATFQYHWNNDHIPDAGSALNILVVDIGGGTTNVCMVRTHPHGRLARGGVNHEPHGVVTIEIGGSQIDELLCRAIGTDKNRVSGYELDKLRLIKESACAELDSLRLWQDYKRVAKAYEFKFDSGNSQSIAASQVYEIIEKSFWPRIAAAIGESIGAIASAEFSAKLEKIDYVLLAGGTGQCGLIKYLFEQAFRKNKLFEDCSIFSSPRFGEAVAHGLVVEALANTNQYSIQAAKTAPYLQQDIVLYTGHARDNVGIPLELRAEAGATEPNRLTGRILEAPRDIASLYNKPMTWRFKLRQKPENVTLEFFRSEDDGASSVRSEDKISSETKRVCRRTSERPGLQCRLTLTVQPDGFAKTSLETRSSESGTVTHEFKPIDLHDLCELKGTVFYALDLGTTSTLVAKGDAAQAAKPFTLPERGYAADQSVLDRLAALEARAETILSKMPNRIGFLEEVKKELVSDYVYHSNRIEGSELSRGATEAVLSGVENSTQLSAIRLERRIVDTVAFIDDQGNIASSRRPIKDELAATNLRDALELTWDTAQTKGRELSPFFLKEVHSLVMRGDPGEVGSFRHGNVCISQTSFVPPDHVQVEAQVQKMFDGFHLSEFSDRPVIFQAAAAHASFVSIHPFHDGNGRIARLLSNYFLWRKGLPGVLLPFDNRDRYYDALEELNSTELISKPSASRNINDLLELFGDLFEDTVEFIQAKVARQSAGPVTSLRQLDVPDSFAIESSSSVTRLGKLLDAITANKKIALSIEDQYANWKSSFQGLLSSARSDFERASRALESASIGSIDIREYPMIEFETYDNIRRGKHFNRTWYFELSLNLRSGAHRLIFYFGRNSISARTAVPELAFTCSLHIARHAQRLGGLAGPVSDAWIPDIEFVHDGSKLGMLVKEDDAAEIIWADDLKFSDWTARLLEEILVKIAGISV